MKFGIDYFPDAHPDRVSGQQYFADILDLAEVADDLGYDSVKIVEHYFTSYVMEKAKARRSIELFARHVMPLFR